MTPSLYEIAVRVNADRKHDPGHVEITVEWGCNDEAWAAASDRETHIAGLHVAGLLARLAAEARPWVEHQRQQHGCQVAHWHLEHDGVYDDSGNRCQIGTFGLLEVSEPTVYIDVPAEAQDEWIDRVRGWLSELARLEVAPSPVESKS